MPIQEKNPRLNATASPIGDLAKLRDEWLSVQANSTCGYFLTWDWIGTWISEFKPRGYVVRIFDDEELVGLGILIPNRKKRWGIVQRNLGYFHQTGNDAEDQIWIEYNGLVAKSGLEVAAYQAVTRIFELGLSELDEIVWSGIAQETQRILSGQSQVRHYETWHAPVFGVDLAKIRASNKSYEDTLSGNTRRQLRRAKRIYEADGKLYLERADSVSRALNFLEYAGDLHRAKWGNARADSAFENSRFLKFHRALISNTWQNGKIDLLSLRCGEIDLAYMYIFRHNHTAYFYLAGVREESSSKMKPGLLGHQFLIEYYLNQEIDQYDFMAGFSQYKKSLGEQTGEMSSLILQRRNLNSFVEGSLRQIKRRWRGSPRSG